MEPKQKTFLHPQMHVVGKYIFVRRNNARKIYLIKVEMSPYRK